MGYNAAGGAGAGSDNGSFFALDLSRSLVWTEFSASYATSGWSVFWYIQLYNNGGYFTIRTISNEFDAIVGGNVDKAYYIASGASSISIQEGFSSSDGITSGSSSIPSSNLQFTFEQAFEGNSNVWYIKSTNSGKYFSYGLTLSDTPVAFFLKR
jgi:hypothetical protein